MRGFYVEADWEPREGYALTEEERSTRVARRGQSVWRNIRGAVTDRPKPVPGPGEVLLKVGAAGICGTDVHLLQQDADGYTCFDGHTHYPIITGHEMSGTVAELGPGVTGFAPGDLVAVESMNWCGNCDPCRRGMFNQCLDVREPGLTYDGGFAEFATVPAKHCYSLAAVRAGVETDQQALELGVLVEPSGVVYNAIFVQADGFRPGAHAVVFGAGPVGLISCAFLRAAGAATVTAVELSPERRELALQLGADHALDPREVDVKAEVAGITAGRGASVVAECTGAPKAVYSTIEGILAPGAVVCQIGIGTTTTPLDAFAFQAKAAHLVGSVGQSGSGIYSDVIAMIASGRVDLLPLVTHRFNLEDVAEAARASTAASTGKVLVSTAYPRVGA